MLNIFILPNSVKPKKARRKYSPPNLFYQFMIDPLPLSLKQARTLGRGDERVQGRLDVGIRFSPQFQSDHDRGLNAFSA